MVRVDLVTREHVEATEIESSSEQASDVEYISRAAHDLPSDDVPS